MKDFSIDGRKINENSYPLIIPEIGINHNGSLKVAKKMIDAAQGQLLKLSNIRHMLLKTR